MLTYVRRTLWDDFFPKKQNQGKIEKLGFYSYSKIKHFI